MPDPWADLIVADAPAKDPWQDLLVADKPGGKSQPSVEEFESGQPWYAKNEFARGVARASTRAAGSAVDFARIFSDSPKLKAIADDLSATAEQVPTKAASIKDVLNDPFLAPAYIGRVTGELAPQAVMAYLTGGAGAAVGRGMGLGATGVRIATGAGSAATSIPQEAGSFFRETEELTGKGNAGAALGFGIPSGLLDALSAERIVGKVFRIADEEGKRKAWRAVVRDAFKEVPKAAGFEATTESMQEGLALLADKAADETFHVLTPENAWRVLEAAVAGGIGGGLLGGGLDVASLPMQKAARDNEAARLTDLRRRRGAREQIPTDQPQQLEKPIEARLTEQAPVEAAPAAETPRPKSFFEDLVPKPEAQPNKGGGVPNEKIQRQKEEGVPLTPSAAVEPPAAAPVATAENAPPAREAWMKDRPLVKAIGPNGEAEWFTFDGYSDLVPGDANLTNVKNGGTFMASNVRKQGYTLPELPADTTSAVPAVVAKDAPTKPVEASATTPQIKFTQGQRVRMGNIEGNLAIYDDGRVAIRTDKGSEFPAVISKLEAVEPIAPTPAPPAPKPKKPKRLRDMRQETPPAVAPRQGEVGGMLAGGEVVLTSSGRQTTPFPKVDTTSDRKSGNTLKRVEEWLHQNAIAEAESRGDEFNGRMFRAEKPGNIPPASKDAMEEYLFGQQPPVQKPLLKPVTPKVESAPATQEVNLDSLLPTGAQRGVTLASGDYQTARMPKESLNEFLDKAKALGWKRALGAEYPDGTAMATLRKPKTEQAPKDSPSLTALRNELKQLRQGLPVAEDMAMNDKGRSLDALNKKISEAQARLDSAIRATMEQQSVDVAKQRDAEANANKPTTEDKISDIQKRREEIKARLRKKLGQTNTGVDPEIATIAAELAVNYAEEGVVRFADFARRVKDDLPDIWERLKQYLGGAWRTAGELNPALDEVNRAETKEILDGFDTAVPAETENVTEVTQPTKKGKEEAAEVEIVKQARAIAETATNPLFAFRRLVKLYNDQPRLGTRTVTSKTNQAYSTPAPLAYLAGQLADLRNGKVIAEPTAGNGMLLIESNPAARLLANELDQDRNDNLRKTFPRADLSRIDASTEDFYDYMDGWSPDRVIANAPFGSAIEGNETKRFKIINAATAKSETPSIDLAISLNTLDTMSADGKAVIIIGSKTGSMGASFGTPEYRAKAYNRPEMLEFFQRFNVVDWFTVDGSLYEKMGAGWPVDVIVIDGKRATLAPKDGGLDRPWVKVPPVFKTWDSLESKLDEAQQRLGARESSRPTGGVGDRPLEPTRGQAGRPIGTPSRPQSSGTLPNVPDAGRPERPAESGQGTTRTPIVPENRPAKPARSSSVVAPASPGQAAPSRPSVVEGETRLNVPYVSVSKNADPNLVAPANLADAMYRAVQKLESDVGKTVDEFVAEKMGWTVPELYKQLSSAQIESVGLFIRNSEARQTGLISADQTGVGKGRQVASIIQYALRNDKVPIFITQGKHLYSDMAGRDLPSIGNRDFTPFITDTEYVYENGNGEEVKEKHISRERREEMRKAAKTEKLPKGKDGIFTTYFQLQSDKPDNFKEAPKDRFKRKKKLQARPDGPRMEMLRALAPNAIFILDEAHMAAGMDSDVGLALQSILKDAAGVFYASATFAKRPDNLTLYSLGSALRLAGLDAKKLAETFQRGGIPLQQAMTSMLAEEGEFVRREQNMEGVDIGFKSATTNSDSEVEAADTYTSFLRDLFRLAEQVNAAAEAEADSTNQTRPEEAQVDLASVNFGSRLFNLSSQYLFALRAEASANESIEALKRGEKPLIAVYNTMEGPIGDLRARNLPISFGGLLQREMVKMLEVKIKDPLAEADPEKGTKAGERLLVLKPEDLPDGGEFFRTLESQINSTDFGAMPISPIDSIKKKIRAAGYTMGEITARDGEVDDSGETVTITKRDKQERNKILGDYNNGQLDGLLINGSGSTGLSAHTDPRFKDQRVRHMIVAQAAPDINVFMQTLGRIMRFGQTKLPKYTVLTTSLAAEKRFMTMLRGKLTSLNANTSAETESGITQGGLADDIFNTIGDSIVAEVMLANPELASLAQIKLPDPTEPESMDDYARRATGKFPLLPNDDADRLWRDISDIYTARIKSLDEAGENPLKANVQDLRAKTTGRTELEAGTGTTAFDGPVVLERTNVQPAKKPFTYDEATKLAEEQDTATRDAVDGWLTQWRAARKERIDTMRSREMTEEQVERTESAMRKVYDNVLEAAALLGKVVGVDTTGTGQPSFYAIPVGLELRGKDTGDFSASSKQALVLATNTLRRRLTIPLSQLDTIQRENIATDTFDESSENVATRYIATGNLLRGYDAAKTIATAQNLTQPQVTMFTTRDGATRTGVLLPAGFNPEKGTGSRWTPVANANEFKASMEVNTPLQAGPVKITGHTLTVPSKSEQKPIWGDREFNDFFTTSPVERRGEFVGQVRKGDEAALYEFLKSKGLIIERRMESEKKIEFGEDEGVATSIEGGNDERSNKASGDKTKATGENDWKASWTEIDSGTEQQADNTHSEALASQDLGTVLADIIEHNRQGIYSPIAQRLLALNLTTSIKRQTHDEFEAENGYRMPEGSQGAYSASRNAVVIFDNDVNQAKTIIHELVHAATVGAIKSNPALQKELTELFNTAKNSPDKSMSQYGMTNGYEFVAEAFSNLGFKEHLRSISTPDNSTLWRKFVNFVRRVLGLSENQTNVLDEVIRLVTPEMRETLPGESDATLASQADKPLADILQRGEREEAGDDYIPTEVFGIRDQVLGKTQYTDAARAKSLDIAQKAFDEAGLKVEREADGHFKLVEGKLDNPAGNRLAAVLKREIEKYGQGALELTELVQSIVLDFKTGRMDGLFGTPVRNKLYSLAQGERSFRGVSLNALRGAAEDIKFVAQNIDVHLQRLWHEAYGGKEIDDTLAKIREKFRAFFTPEVIQQIVDANPALKALKDAVKIISDGLDTEFSNLGELRDTFASLLSKAGVKDSLPLARQIVEALRPRIKLAAKEATDDTEGKLTAEQKIVLKGRKPIWQRIVEAVERGEFDNGPLLREKARANGWKPPSDEEIARIKRLAERERELQQLSKKELDAAGGDQAKLKREQIIREESTLPRRLPLMRQMEAAWANITRPVNFGKGIIKNRVNNAAFINELISANLLFRLSFAPKQALSVLSQLAFHIPTRAIAQAIESHGQAKSLGQRTALAEDIYREMKGAFKSALAGYKDGISQFVAALKGRGEARNVERLTSGIAAIERLDAQAEQYKEQGKTGMAILFKTMAFIRLGYRVAQAFDNLHGVPSEYIEMRHQAVNGLMKNGMERTGANAQADNIIESIKADHIFAMQEAKAFLEEQGEKVTPEKLREISYRIARRWAYEKMRTLGLPADDFMAQNKQLRETIGWNEREAGTASIGGAVGGAVALTGKVAEKIGIPLAVGRFGNAIAIGINRALHFTPMGFFPGAFGGENNAWFRTELDRNQRKVEAAVGTMMGSMAFLLALSGIFAVRLRWPEDKEERDLFEAQGHRPNTLEIAHDDGSFTAISLNTGFAQFLAPYLAAGGALRDLLETREKRQTKLNADAAKKGLPPEKIRPMSTADMMGVAAQAGYQMILGGRTSAGALASIADYGTPNVTKAVASQVAPTIPLLPAMQEISRMSGVVLDSKLASFTDLLLPLPSSPARRFNFLGDPAGTPDDLQRIVQTLTGGSYWNVDPNQSKTAAAYRTLFDNGFRPPSVNPNKGYAIGNAFRPFNDAELERYTEARGQEFKNALGELPANADSKAIRGAYRLANGRALARMGVTGAVRKTSTRSMSRGRGLRSRLGNTRRTFRTARRRSSLRFSYAA